MQDRNLLYWEFVNMKQDNVFRFGLAWRLRINSVLPFYFEPVQSEFLPHSFIPVLWPQTPKIRQVLLDFVFGLCDLVLKPGFSLLELLMIKIPYR